MISRDLVFILCDKSGCRRKVRRFWWDEGTKQSDGWRAISSTTGEPQHTCPLHSLEISEFLDAAKPCRARA